jgi:chemotaxis protein MotA
MDIATVIGIVVGFGLIIGSILMGSSLMAFINVPGILIVVGGTVASALIAEKMSVFVGSARVAMHAFLHRAIAVDQTIKRLLELSVVVRKEGLLALESQEIDDPFMAKGVRLAVDGLSVDEVRSALLGEMHSLRDRHKQGQKLFRFMGATAPAMGMVGTLIGLVQMLQVMDDPSSIGPAMAVALLTTFYGAVLAFLLFIPIADKLETRTKDESQNMSVVLAGIESILKAENPRIVQERLEAFLAPKHRTVEENDE